jgi:hypothetical protein
MALVLTRTQNLGPMPTPHPSARTSSHRPSRVRQIGARAHLRGWARRNITEYGSPGGRVWAVGSPVRVQRSPNAKPFGGSMQWTGNSSRYLLFT